MANITLEQLKNNSDCIIDLCNKFKIDATKLRIYGEILGPNSYKGKQSDLNFLSDEPLALTTKMAFERELANKLIENGIFCSIQLVTVDQLKENLFPKIYQQVIMETVFINDLPKNCCSLNL
ncbi:MAG: hypothetical protein LEGION0398_MBIBDBAK_01228 [Legionellaceae bacterium]